MTDRELIEIGAKALTARQGFSDLKEMRQRDLEYLCTSIEEKTDILISLSTIKRIMNGQYNRLPQVATLNAISQYLGYADWQAFKVAHPDQVDEPKGEIMEAHTTTTPPRTATTTNDPTTSAATSLPAQKAASASKNRLGWRLPRLFAGIGVAILLLVITISWSHLSNSAAKEAKLASFSIKMTNPHSVPNTVVFSYDIDRLSGDSFFIQQSWDKSRRIRVYKQSHTLTDIYYEPGYHTAKLIENDQVIKTLGVSIPTDKWFLYSKENLGQGQPSYIWTDRPIQNGILGIDKKTLVDNNIDPEKNQVYLYTYFPSTIEADADNFDFTAHIKMRDVRNNACPWLMPEIYCQSGFMYCPLTMPGCTGGVSAEFGDHPIEGKDQDLSNLAVNVYAWHHLELMVRNKHAIFSIDGKPVLSTTYNSSAGLITGLGFTGSGLCDVDSIHLADLSGKVVYPR
jgi:transcriptional regulator with XRE-family HTH domain